MHNISDVRYLELYLPCPPGPVCAIRGQRIPSQRSKTEIWYTALSTNTIKFQVISLFFQIYDVLCLRREAR